MRFNGRLLATHTSTATARAALAAPVRRADRNELSFRHVYEVTAEAAASGRYLIGTTGARSPVDIEVRSAALPYGNDASIRMNGHELVPERLRGYWIAAIAPDDGHVLWVERFDTHATTAESGRLVARVTGLPAGTIVIAAALDETAWQLTEEAVRALRGVGGRADLRETQWLSHVLIGVQGAAAGQAVESWGPGPVRAVVGRVRAVDLSLDDFALVADGPS